MHVGASISAEMSVLRAFALETEVGFEKHVDGPKINLLDGFAVILPLVGQETLTSFPKIIITKL